MFKAAAGQNRWVRESGWGTEVIVHLEEFCSWPEWLITCEQVFFLKANDAWNSHGFIFQLSSQEKVDLGQNFDQPKEIGTNWTYH